MTLVPLYIYYALLGGLTLHGLHRALLCLRVLRLGKQPRPTPALSGPEPTITVQLPLFNELYVADRLIDAVCAQDWPRDRLEIQVLDDSTDETTVAVAKKVAAKRAEGFAIDHIRRPDRTGFKAGALEFGLRERPIRGRYVAILDADFVPRPDFLRRSVPLLEADPGLSAVQARWGWLNRDHSLLTRLQAVYLDAHFAVEHSARQSAGHFLNFNGTAGIWRRDAIEAAGGWQHDTITEDLDLSFRSQLGGGRFAYLDDVVVPSELPVEMNGFKSQQYRWAKGSIETARKLLGRVFGASRLRWSTRIEAAVHLVNNSAYVLLCGVAVLALPVALSLSDTPVNPLRFLDAWLIGIGMVPAVAYFMLGQLRVGRGFFESLWLMPPALALGIGASLNNAKAVLGALLGRPSPFVRTPKYRVESRSDTWLDKNYRVARNLLPVLELVLGASCAAAAVLAGSRGGWSTFVLMLVFTQGFVYVGVASLAPVVSEQVRRMLSMASKTTPRSRIEQPRQSSA